MLWTAGVESGVMYVQTAGRSQTHRRAAAQYGGPMITGSHVIVYSRDADADRAFFSDVLNYPHVDAGGGWLIFKLPPGEVAMHPTDGPQSHELYLMCDDINATIEHLAGDGNGVDGGRGKRGHDGADRRPLTNSSPGSR